MVLKEIAEGQTQRQVALTLGLTVAGVRSHVDDLKRVTGCETSRDLARWRRAERECWGKQLARDGGCSTEP